MKKWVSKSYIFACGFVIIFIMVQKILACQDGYIYQLWADYEKMEEDSVQCIMLGTSHVCFSFCPQYLYNEEKITAYNLGAGSLNMRQMYYRLEEAYKTQNPKIVIVDAGPLFYTDEVTEYNTDIMSLSGTKVKYAYSYAKSDKDGDFNEDFWGTLFPLYKYHSKWSSISEDNFTPIKGNEYNHKGHYETVKNRSYDFTPETMNDEISQIETLDENLYKPEMSEENIGFLLAIKELCDAHGSQLLLTKIPVISSVRVYPTVWTQERYSKVRNMADTYGIDYWDILYESDWDSDARISYFDHGHMNIRGAEATTDIIGKYLREHYDLEYKTDAQYENTEVYDKIQTVAEIENENDMTEYLKKLDEIKDNSVIVIAVNENMVAGLNDEDKKYLEQLGLSHSFSDDDMNKAYVAVIENGKVTYEKNSAEKIDYEFEMNGKSFEIESSGYWTGSEAKIMYDQSDYAVNSYGMNIVILDTESNLIIDSVTLNPTLDRPHSVVHTDKIQSLYEK